MEDRCASTTHLRKGRPVLAWVEHLQGGGVRWGAAWDALRRGERPEPAQHEGVAGAGDKQRAALAAPGVQHLTGHDEDCGVAAHRLREAARPARRERDGREERLRAAEWAAGDELQQRPQPALHGLRVCRRRRCRRHGAEPGGE